MALAGFLNQTTGAKLHRVLSALGAPTHADDKRTGAERRVDALDRLVTGVLENGLPSDKGVRPQLSVIVDVETLHTAMTTPPEAVASTATPPAELVGFGPIGPKLLSYLGCTSDITGILTTGGELPQARILNVGRTHRLATPAQRRAVIARQGGVCANTRLQEHAPRDPPRHALEAGRPHRPRRTGRLLRRVPPSGAPRTPPR